MSSPQHRVVLCDDNMLRLQSLAMELKALSVNTVIELVFPRRNFTSSICASQKRGMSCPPLVFIVNIGFEDIISPTRNDSGGDHSTCQLFQICHISCDHLVKSGTLSALRYVFTMSTAVLEIALCIVDTICKYTCIVSGRTNNDSDIQREGSIKPLIHSTNNNSSMDNIIPIYPENQVNQHDHSSVTNLYSSMLPAVQFTRPKILVSRGTATILPRVRYVNRSFEVCFKHTASWICGRSITSLCGLLTCPVKFLKLCAQVNGHMNLNPAQPINNDICEYAGTKLASSAFFDVIFYSANGIAIAVQVWVAGIPNCTNNQNMDSVAILTLDCWPTVI